MAFPQKAPEQLQLPYEPQALEAAIAGEGPDTEDMAEGPSGQMDPKALMQMLLQMGIAPDKIKAILEIILGGQGPQVG